MYGKTGRAYCTTCKAAARQKKKEPPCDTCKNRMPRLMPDVEPIFKAITICDSQVRAGFGGIYGLDWSIIIRVADDMGIVTDELFYRCLKQAEAIIVTEAAKNRPGRTDGRSGNKTQNQR